MASSSSCGDKRFGSVRFVASFQIESLATPSARELPVVWLVRVFLNLSGTAGHSQSVTDFSGHPTGSYITI
jgi:hypothetical protein